MNWTIRDSFTLAASTGSANAADRINARILESIRRSVKNVEVTSEKPIVFKRPARQGGFVGIKSFGSGTVSIVDTGGSLEVGYELGIEPYLRLMLLVPGFAILLYHQSWTAVGIALVAVAMTAWQLGRLAYSKGVVRAWFKAIAKAALEEA